MMMSVTIFTVRKLLSSRKKSDTITTVATIESTEPGTVPSVKSRGTFLRAEGGPTGQPGAPRCCVRGRPQQRRNSAASPASRRRARRSHPQQQPWLQASGAHLKKSKLDSILPPAHGASGRSQSLPAA